MCRFPSSCRVLEKADTGTRSSEPSLRPVGCGHRLSSDDKKLGESQKRGPRRALAIRSMLSHSSDLHDWKSGRLSTWPETRVRMCLCCDSCVRIALESWANQLFRPSPTLQTARRRVLVCSLRLDREEPGNVLPARDRQNKRSRAGPRICNILCGGPYIYNRSKPRQ